MIIKRHEKSGFFVSLCGRVFQEKHPIDSEYPEIVTPRKRLPIHRLVAETHIPNTDPEKTFVCHRNDNPKDNNAFNLFWGSHKDNMNDMIAKKRHLGRKVQRFIELVEINKKISVENDLLRKRLSLETNILKISVYRISNLLKVKKDEAKKMLIEENIPIIEGDMCDVKIALPWVLSVLEREEREYDRFISNQKSV